MRVVARVTAGARREKVEKISDTEYRVVVREEAINNSANDRVRSIMAHEYQVSLSQVRIAQGHTSQRKVLEILVY